MKYGSVDVDLEARHLRQIRRGGEVQQMHVLEHVVPIEPAEDEDPSVGLQRGVVSARGGGASCDGARLETERHWTGVSGCQRGGDTDAALRALTQIK